MTNVTCVGITVHDVVYRVDRLPRGSGKTHSNQLELLGGGIAANAASSIVRLGGEARLISAVGDDIVGTRLVAELTDAGVDTSGVQVRPGVPSSQSAVAVDKKGERSILNHTDPRLFGSAPLPAESEYAGSDAVMVDVRWPQAADQALGWAKRHNKPGVVDYDMTDQGSAHLLEVASHVIFSRPALAAFTGDDAIERSLIDVQGSYETWVAVTAGADGVFWLDRGELYHQPGFDVEVVDSTGAGDVFHGAFTYFLAESGDIRHALTTAAAASALSCTEAGGRAGVPTRSALFEFLETRS